MELWWPRKLPEPFWIHLGSSWIIPEIFIFFLEFLGGQNENSRALQQATLQEYSASSSVRLAIVKQDGSLSRFSTGSIVSKMGHILATVHPLHGLYTGDWKCGWVGCPNSICFSREVTCPVCEEPRPESRLVLFIHIPWLLTQLTSPSLLHVRFPAALLQASTFEFSSACFQLHYRRKSSAQSGNTSQKSRMKMKCFHF